MVFLRQILHNNRQRKERMKKFLITTVLGIATTAAFGAASLRAPQIGGTATVTTPTATNTARAGTMRAQTMKTSSISAPSVTTTQSIATPISTETTDARIALLKGIKGFNPGKVKDTTAAQQELNAIDSRIEELQNKLDAAESAQVNIESKTYTKDEIDTLIAESEQKVPKIDERGNWTDPNGGLIAVPEGAVVIGPNDITIVDGKLSTTSTHPIQNKTVTNALNEKQNQSTTLSFGNADGGWTPVTIGSDYIELHTDSSNAKEIRIRPTMIATSLDDMENEDQLITAGAVQEAIANLTTNPGGGTQPNPYFNLINLETRLDGLVQRYTYETNASYIEMQTFASNFCARPLSPKWCHFYQTTDTSFAIIVRTVGHYLLNYDTVFAYDDNGSPTLYTTRFYAVNAPDEVNMIQYSNENFCNNRDKCFLSAVHLDDEMNIDPIGAIYNVLVYSEATRLTELPEEYKEENQQTLDD